MKPVEALARIRFNPGNLERWLAAACSLADVSLDAPQRDKVLAAAREARALGLLIDHLRCLFTHQWGVEEEAAAVQFIHQQANHSPAATTLDGSFLMTNTIHQLQDMEDQKALIFSHSNQQTLFRAARNLTSLVARILFLTDGSFEEQQDDNAMPTTQETNNKKPARLALGDNTKFDNAANYSQLVRSFGELASELLDLGFCCLQAQQNNNIQYTAQHNLSNYNNYNYYEQTATHTQGMFYGNRHIDDNVDNIDNNSTNCDSMGRPLNNLNPHDGMELQAATNSDLQAQQQQQQQQNTCQFPAIAPKCVLRDLLLSFGGGQNGLLRLRKITLEDHLQARIQDMKNLFQVNRLIIDRFILPLLSASKCCLRGGAELERGIEARRSILGQIRASIGIIMAVIKLSIFEPEQHFIFHQQRDISSPSNMDEINSMSNFTTQTPQFEPHYLPLEGFDDGVMISNDGGSPIEPVTSNENRQSSLAQNTTNDEPAHERSANLFRVTSASVLGRRQHQNQSTPNANPMPRLNRFQRTLKWDQQIMNYFLLNANASLSVHDAIDRLQLLVEPFSRANNHRTLRSALNDTFEMHHWLRSRSLGDCVGGQHQSAISSNDRSVSRRGTKDLITTTTTTTITANDSNQPKGNHWPAAWATAGPPNVGLRQDFSCRGGGDYGGAPETGFRAGEPNQPGHLDGHVINEEESCCCSCCYSPYNLAYYSCGPNYNSNNNNNRIIHPSRTINCNEDLLLLKERGACGPNVSPNLTVLPPPPPPPQSRLSVACPSMGSSVTNQNKRQTDDTGAPRASQSRTTTTEPIFDAMLMDKRQLINALTGTFLGNLRSSLVDRVQEFTDSAYTKHEQRETIIQLVQSIKLQLNKLVKLLYRMRRRPTIVNEFNLAQLRHLAIQFDDTCTELKLELQNVVVEQSDELDQVIVEMDLIKQIKQQTLIGDCEKVSHVLRLFQDQADRLIELCKMLNQVASTNKLKMSTKSLAIWFELNTSHLLSSAHSLSQEPRLRILKDHLWAYIQVWCSFYDDFCQLARQSAYLAHSQFDSARTSRIALLRQQLRVRQHQQLDLLANYSPSFMPNAHFSIMADQQHQPPETPTSIRPTHYNNKLLGQANSSLSLSQPIECLRTTSYVEPPPPPLSCAGGTDPVPSSGPGALNQNQNQQQQRPRSNNHQRGQGPSSESPRSLDHYHGFGSNYHQMLGRDHYHNDNNNYNSNFGPTPTPTNESSQGLFLVNQFQRQRQHENQQAHGSHGNGVPASPGYGFGADSQLGDKRRHSQQHEPNGNVPLASSCEPTSNASGQQFTISQQHQHRVGQHFSMTSEQAMPLEPSFQGVSSAAFNQHQLQFQFQQQRIEQNNRQLATGSGGLNQSDVAVVNQRRVVTIDSGSPLVLNQEELNIRDRRSGRRARETRRCDHQSTRSDGQQNIYNNNLMNPLGAVDEQQEAPEDQDLRGAVGRGCDEQAEDERDCESNGGEAGLQSSGDPDADAIVRGAKETAQMALSMYQFIRGEGDLNTTQDLFTQAELFAEEANELYKEVRCFSYKVPSGDLKRDLLGQLSAIPGLVQQLQFVVKSPTVGNAATFAKVDSVIRETRGLMEAVNRVVNATMGCRQHYNMTVASRKRTRTMSPAYRSERGSLEFDGFPSRQSGALGGGRQMGGAAGMGSEPDI